MVIAAEIRNKVASFPPGKVFGISDLTSDYSRTSAIVMLLGRMQKEGTIKRLSKGRYYKPKNTVFGTLVPIAYELYSDLLVKEGKPIGYITGPQAFSEMGLTTQISGIPIIGTNQYRRPITRKGQKISFLLQRNKVTRANIPLLRLLDAIRMFREIPATTPDEAIASIRMCINNLSEPDRARITELSLKYTAYVRAILGAILSENGGDTYGIITTLNSSTSYHLPISENTLINKKNWHIL